MWDESAETLSLRGEQKILEIAKGLNWKA